MWVRLEREGQFEAVTDPLTDYYVHPKSLSANPERMLQALDRIIDTTLLVADRVLIAGLEASDSRGPVMQRFADRPRKWIRQRSRLHIQVVTNLAVPLVADGRYAMLVASMASKFFHPRRGCERIVREISRPLQTVTAPDEDFVWIPLHPLTMNYLRGLNSLVALRASTTICD